VSWDDVLGLLPGALAIAVVGFAQSIAIVKSYAATHNRAVDANQEMIAYGAANLGAGLLQGFAVTGSLSKSAAAQEARAKSQVAPLVSAVMVVLTILFLAGLFRDLPEAVLAAVVIEAVSGMVRIGKLTSLRRGRTPEFFAAAAAMLGVLLIGILPGVVIGVALSFALLIHTLDHPHVARIGRSPDGDEYADREIHPEFEPLGRVLVERFESPLIFANADLFVTEMSGRVREADGAIDALVLDFEAVSQIDVTGSDALLRLHDALSQDGIRLVLARTNATVRASLERSGGLAAIGAGNSFPTVRDAVAGMPTGES
jgi:MFS superfamily sulfate permease-like transporter